MLFQMKARVSLTYFVNGCTVNNGVVSAPIIKLAWKKTSTREIFFALVSRVIFVIFLVIQVSNAAVGND